MEHVELSKEMTIYELAQFMIEYCASKEDLKQFATKEDLELLEKRLTRKIDTNYVSINKRIDLVS